MPELTNFGGVVGCAKDELRGTIIARADIRDVRLVRNQDLGASEIAELEDAGIWIKQKVLRFDISMADALRVNVGEGAEKLVNIDLDLEDWHGCLHLVEKS